MPGVVLEGPLEVCVLGAEGYEGKRHCPEVEPQVEQPRLGFDERFSVARTAEDARPVQGRMLDGAALPHRVGAAREEQPDHWAVAVKPRGI